MKRNNKKGFTIVELVIVIAVIAILAAVMIPTFAGIIDAANDSNLDQAAKNAYTNYLIDHAADAPDELTIKIADGADYVYYSVADGQIDFEQTEDAPANTVCNYTGDGYSVYYGTHNTTGEGGKCSNCGK